MWEPAIPPYKCNEVYVGTSKFPPYQCNQDENVMRERHTLYRNQVRHILTYRARMQLACELKIGKKWEFCLKNRKK